MTLVEPRKNWRASVADYEATGAGMDKAAIPVSSRVGGGQQGQLLVAADTIVAPDLSLPLIHEPAQASPGVQPVGPLAQFIGTWRNANIAGSGRGDPSSPFSYNLMVLPQAPSADPASPFGYILKSMSYYEELTFSQIHGAAANRGGAGTQVSNALLYEQRVYISDGPAKDTLVHFENGIWGFLEPMAQALGPYGDGDGSAIGTETFGAVPPPLQYNIFKQISVPHGNSVLACGNVVLDANSNAIPVPGAPMIEPPPQVLPTGIETSIYAPPETVQNLIPAYALNPNLPLTEALSAAPVERFIRLDVSSSVGGGTVANIDFEQERADVTQYQATYWLEDIGSGNFDQLQYSQTIMLEIPIVLPGMTELTDVLFPHITSNTLTRVGAAA